ncbi:ABC transporter permease [Nocardioides campestrisoli]|uniref:ABC transporter permease n=1 Tax=Nocardioides campestrisoli TaxID=2736757 RepID=UPI0015E7427E|nr:ABC transporter permease [Nocardioides campestrisoli]
MSTLDSAPRTLDVSGTPKTPFARLVKVELRKSFDTRAGLWLIGSIVVITALVMAIVYFASDEHTFGNYLSAASTPQSLLLPVLGILLVTSEWSQRTAMVTFALEPSRSRVVGAKTVAAMIFGAGAFVAAIVLGALATLLSGGTDGFAGFEWGDSSAFFLLQLFTILQGLAYGLLLLNTPAAIVLFFGLPIVMNLLFSLVDALRDAAPWIDLATAQMPLFSSSIDLSGEEWAQLGSTTLIWIVIPFVLGWLRLLKAEVK